jgi:hypothetical protein
MNGLDLLLKVIVKIIIKTFSRKYRLKNYYRRKREEIRGESKETRRKYLSQNIESGNE